MKPKTLAFLAAFAAWILVLPSCVELCGQRISWFHDPRTDELRVLIFYDGIHDSGDTTSGTGVEQVPQFVRDGDVMITDWVGHLRLGEWRAAAVAPGATDQDKEWGVFLSSLRAEPIGHFREPDGRIGAAQLVTISSVSHFIKRANALIDRAVLADVDESGLPPRTITAMKASAMKGHTWVALDGQSIRIDIPADPSEWAALKGRFLAAMIAQVSRSGPPVEGDGKEVFMLLARLVASVPISYAETSSGFTITLGRPDTPSTLRLAIRDTYEPSLERVVMETIKEEVGARLSSLGWAPPEAAVGSALDQARRDPGATARVVEALQKIGTHWNQSGAWPAAPSSIADPNTYLEAWRAWYRKMKNYPLEP